MSSLLLCPTHSEASGMSPLSLDGESDSAPIMRDVQSDLGNMAVRESSGVGGGPADPWSASNAKEAGFFAESSPRASSPELG